MVNKHLVGDPRHTRVKTQSNVFSRLALLTEGTLICELAHIRPRAIDVCADSGRRALHSDFNFSFCFPHRELFFSSSIADSSLPSLSKVQQQPDGLAKFSWQRSNTLKGAAYSQISTNRRLDKTQAYSCKSLFTLRTEMYVYVVTLVCYNKMFSKAFKKIKNKKNASLN